MDGRTMSGLSNTKTFSQWARHLLTEKVLLLFKGIAQNVTRFILIAMTVKKKREKNSQI